LSVFQTSASRLLMERRRIPAELIAELWLVKRSCNCANDVFCSASVLTCQSITHNGNWHLQWLLSVCTKKLERERQQVAEVIWQRPHRNCVPSPSNFFSLPVLVNKVEYTIFLGHSRPKSHTKRDVDRCSRVCRGRLTDAGMIDCNSPRLMHWRGLNKNRRERKKESDGKGKAKALLRGVGTYT